MTCLTFPFGEASWQLVVVVEDVARVPIVRAAEPFVATAAASASTQPAVSAASTPSLLLLIDVSPLVWMTAGNVSRSVLDDNGRGGKIWWLSRPVDRPFQTDARAKPA